MMTKPEISRQRKMLYLANKKSYLEKLNNLIILNNQEHELLPIDESDELRNNDKYKNLTKNSIENNYYKKISIPLDQKEKKLSGIVEEILYVRDCPCYLWVQGSNECSLAKLSSLKYLNFNYDPFLDNNGVVFVTSADLLDGLSLDVYQENNAWSMDIEVFGEKWSTVNL